MTPTWMVRFGLERLKGTDMMGDNAECVKVKGKLLTCLNWT